jgi:CheY-like chemotaxis protein
VSAPSRAGIVAQMSPVGERRPSLASVVLQGADEGTVAPPDLMVEEPESPIVNEPPVAAAAASAASPVIATMPTFAAAAPIGTDSPSRVAFMSMPSAAALGTDSPSRVAFLSKPPVPPQLGVAPTISFAGHRALIVEDNATNVLVLQRLLHKLSMASDVACDGLRALQMLERVQSLPMEGGEMEGGGVEPRSFRDMIDHAVRPYSIVLMDLHMPVMVRFCFSEANCC